MFAAGIAVVVNYMICVDAVPSARPAYRVINKHVRPRTMTQRSSQPDSRLTPSNRPLLCESESLSWPLTTSGLIAIGRMADMSTIHRHSECRSQLHALPTPPAFSPPYSLRAIQSASAPAAPSGRILHQPEDQPPPPPISSPTPVERRCPGSSPALSLPLGESGEKKKRQGPGEEAQSRPR